MSWQDAAPNLPPGWAWAELHEVADVHLGKMLDAKKKTGRHPRPYLRNINVQWHAVCVDDLLVMDIGPEESDRYSVRAGDVVICEGGEPGRCAVVPEAADGLAFQKALHRVRAASGVVPEYLAYALEFATRAGYTSGALTGSTIKHLPLEKIRLLQLPVPPTQEQQRIASALAELDSHMARLLATLDGLDRKARGYMKSVLRSAVAGQLAPPAKACTTRQTLHGLRRDVHARSKAVPPALTPTPVPEEWPVVSLSDLTWDVDYGTSTRCSYEGQGLGVLRIPNVAGGRIDPRDLKFAVDSSVSLSGSVAKPGDVLVVRTNGSRELIGRCAAVTSADGHAFASYLIRLRLLSEVVDPEWVVLVLSAPHWRRLLESRAASSAGQHNLSIDKLSDVPVPLPTMSQQQALIRLFKERREAMETAQTGLKRHRLLLKALRTGYSEQAFSGAVSTQVPHQEPAGVLLRRIQAERTARGSTAGRRRAGTVRRRGTSVTLLEEESA